MKQALLIAFIFFLTSSYTQEQEKPVDEAWIIGRFILVKDQAGYYARTGDIISDHHKTGGKAINQLINHENN